MVLYVFPNDRVILPEFSRFVSAFEMQKSIRILKFKHKCDS